MRKKHHDHHSTSTTKVPAGTQIKKTKKKLHLLPAHQGDSLTVKEQIEIEDAKASSNHTPHRTAAHRGYTARHRREGSGEDEQPLPSLCRAGRRLPAAVPLALSASQRVFRAWRR